MEHVAGDQPRQQGPRQGLPADIPAPNSSLFELSPVMEGTREHRP
jgi:hypothetical protein